MVRERCSRATWIAWAGVVAAVLAVGGCRSAAAPGSGASDLALASQVEARLAADPAVSRFEIEVRSDHGVVRLNGTVDDERARRQAVRIAARTPGVRDVVDDIRIGVPAFTGNVDDAWIRVKIKAKLTAAPDIDRFKVDVAVHKGVVTLTGTVPTELARDHAGELARTTRGVLSVDNAIEVGRAGD